jgi:hypothetical protein
MMVSPGRRARSRMRNRRVLLMVAGLVALAVVCTAALASTFAGIGSTHKAHPKKKAAARVVHTTTTHAPAPTSAAPAPAPATAAAPPTSTPPRTVRVTTTTAKPASTTTVVTTPTPPTLPAATAFASIADLPEWCTVTVHVSNGSAHAYQLAQFLQNPGDLYKFTAYVGGYRVDVSTTVVDRNNSGECDTTLAHLGPA